MRTKRLARLALNAGFIMLVSIMCVRADQPILALPGGPLSDRGPGTGEAAAAHSVSSGTSGLSNPASTDAGSGEGGACAVGVGCAGPSAAGAALDAPPLGLLEPSTNLLPVGTISVTLHLTTSVPSNCRWSEAAPLSLSLVRTTAPTTRSSSINRVTAKQIFFTGGWCTFHGYYHGQHGAEHAEAQGVAPERIAIDESRVTSTYDEVVLLKEFIARSQAPIRSVIVVSDAFHGRRAVFTYRLVLGDAVAVQFAPVPFEASTYQRRWWTDRASQQYVRDEYMKLPYYCARYRVSWGPIQRWLAAMDRD